MAKICEPCELAGMGKYGAVGDRCRSARHTFRSVSLRFIAALASISLSGGPASGDRPVGMRSVDHRAPGGWMAERTVTQIGGHYAQGSRLPARSGTAHLAVLRGSFLGGASLAGSRQHSGKPVAGEPSNFPYEPRTVSHRAVSGPRLRVFESRRNVASHRAYPAFPGRHAALSWAFL